MCERAVRERERLDLDMESSRTNPVDLKPSSSHSKYGGARPLNLGCRIFISHSGNNKDFVRHLHDKLINLFHDDGTVFFDEKSLPTAEPISMENILAEARGCELGVLVLTEDFFMHTPNPMLELETLTTNEVRLLPLFFRISVDDFKKMRHYNVWEERWSEWLKEDKGRLRAWKHALNFVDRFSGLEYCKLANNDLEFIRKVVTEVEHIIHPANPYSDEGLWGMARLCKIVNDMYKECALKRASDGCTQVASTSASAGCREDNGYSLDLVGMYGFAGLGKSTLCRCLCNYYCAEFHGKVCWLDLGSTPDASQASSQTYSRGSSFMWRMKCLLSTLTSKIENADSLTSFQIQNRLRNWIRKDPIFLAIDNVLQDSLEEADFYLRCTFAKGSKIFITARQEKILEQVIGDYTRFSAVIGHIPKLKFEEARGIFVHQIPKLVRMSNVEDEVNECVSACVIRPDNDRYHPLMLISAARSIKRNRRHNADLKIRLREFIQSTIAIDKSNAWKTVFETLDISYAILSEEAKKVFLDLSLFYKFNTRGGWSCSSYAWIRSVYSHVDTKKLQNIFWSLEDLSFINIEYLLHVGKKNIIWFLEDWSFMSSISMKDDAAIRVHDLMVEFSKYKVMQGGAGAAGCTPHYLVLDNGAQLRNQAFSFLLAKVSSRNEWPSVSALPMSVRTVSISGCSSNRPGEQALEQLDLRNLEGVEVLHLVDNPGVQEVLLSRTTLAHLRSFIVRGPVLKNGGRGSLRCTIDEDWPTPPTASRMLTTGGKLAWLELEGNVILSTCRKPRPWWSGGERSLLQRLGFSRSSAVCGLEILQPVCCNLQYLALSSTFYTAKSIDLMTCTNLKRLRLTRVLGLRDIHGLETLTNLVKLNIEECDELVLLSIPANLIRLTAWVNRCRSLERISLPKTSHRPEADRSACASHGKLSVSNCPALKNVDGIGQYTGHCEFRVKGGMPIAMRELLEPFETGSSKLKVNVQELELEGYPVQLGLAGLRCMSVTDAQHVGLLISALAKAQPKHLSHLRLRCKEDGDCGCDKNEPHLGPGLSTSWFFAYHCPQVRNLASLPDRLTCLSLSGCRNVEVWPDFATMTSLKFLNLSYTSLKELPTSAAQLQLPLKELDIQGCWQLPVQEMIKAITYCKPQGYISAWGRGSLASLLADLKGHRRDRGSVADALDSRWPELVALFHEQWRYLRYPYPYPILWSSYPITGPEFWPPGSQLCYLIRLMYELWFGVECKAEAGSTCACADTVPTMKEKLKRLLCSEIFMALPFYVWRIGRTRLHAVDEWEEYPWPEGYESYMAFALIGSASIGCFNASLNDDLKDRMVNFVQSFAEAKLQRAVEDLDAVPVSKMHTSASVILFRKELHLTKKGHERLAIRVGDAICKMTRAPSVAAALGQNFMHITMDGLKASYSAVEMAREACESSLRWLNRTSYWSTCSDSDVKISREACESLAKWLILVGKPSVAALKSGEASMDDDGLDLGARVLHKIMLKILPLSVLNFEEIWTAVSKIYKSKPPRSKGSVFLLRVMPERAALLRKRGLCI